MPSTPLPPTILEFLAKPNPAVIASSRPDGQPISVPTWYKFENGRILLNLADSRKRLAYLRNDPRVSLTVLAADDWHSHVSLQGRVSSLTDDPDSSVIDRIARHYIGQNYPLRDQRRVSAWIDIERWHAWGAIAQTLG